MPEAMAFTDVTSTWAALGASQVLTAFQNVPALRGRVFADQADDFSRGFPCIALTVRPGLLKQELVQALANEVAGVVPMLEPLNRGWVDEDLAETPEQ